MPLLLKGSFFGESADRILTLLVLIQKGNTALVLTWCGAAVRFLNLCVQEKNIGAPIFEIF